MISLILCQWIAPANKNLRGQKIIEQKNQALGMRGITLKNSRYVFTKISLLFMLIYEQFPSNQYTLYSKQHQIRKRMP